MALRKAVLNNKKQRGESHLVSCFISTSNALVIEHPGYHNMKGWGKDEQSHNCPLSSTLRYCHTSIVVFRKIAGRIDRERFILEDGNHTPRNKHVTSSGKEVFCLEFFVCFLIVN